MTSSFGLGVKWRIDGKSINLTDTMISTSYMNRGQDRNITDPSLLKSISIYIQKDMFTEMIQPLYEEVLEDEKTEIDHTPGEVWYADMMHEKDFPSFIKLWSDSEDALVKFAIEWQSEFLDMLHVGLTEWKEHNYYIHDLNEYVLGEREIEFKGTVIHSPFMLETLLKNLIENISNHKNTEQILIESLQELERGGKKALEALPYIEPLINHPNKEVSQTAKSVYSTLSV